MLKKAQRCHSEEPQATKDLRLCLIPQMPGFFAEPGLSETQGFFAALRMTRPKHFSATC
jgi:hypothetical protein